MANRPYKVWPLAVILTMGLTACDQSVSNPLTPGAQRLRPPGQSFVPFEGGLRVVPDGREISFGRDWAGVEAVLTGQLGAPEDRAPCGRYTAVRWGELTLVHNGHSFIGLGCPSAAT